MMALTKYDVIPRQESFGQAVVVVCMGPREILAGKISQEAEQSINQSVNQNDAC